MKIYHLLTSVLLSLCFLTLNGQPGTLRTGFADNGIFTLDLTSEDEIQDMALLSDGSVVVSGYLANNSNGGIIMRISETGELIWSKEIALTQNSSSTAFQGIVVRNDEIFVQANHYNPVSSKFEIVILKFDKDGNQNTDFGENGRAVAVIDNGLLGFEMAIDGEGNLYVIGRTYVFNSAAEDGLVVKFKSNGALDSSFGENGISAVGVDNFRTGLLEGAIINGELYVVGWYHDTGTAVAIDENGMVMKLKADGSKDLNFGNNGTIKFDVSNSDIIDDIVPHGEDHFLIGGSGGTSKDDIYILRYTLSGDLDSNFGNNGRVVLNYGEDDDVSELLVRNDLGIYVCATINDIEDFAVISLNPDGSVDASFGTNGKIVVDIDDEDNASEGLIMHNGDILIGGESNEDIDGDFAIVRIEGYPQCANNETNMQVSGCEVVTFDGTSYKQSGVYNLVYQTSGGCDSIIHLNVKINNASQETISISDCDPIVINGETYAATGTFMQTLVAQNGCDSVLTVNITIDNARQETISLSDCEPIVINGETYSATGTFMQTLVAQNGCDSVLTVNITIDNSRQETISLSDCDPIVINGETYSETGSYMQTLVAQNGCDSVLTVNVNIENLESSIQIDESGTLSSEINEVQYQWYNCSNAAIVAGETSSSFSPSETGDYALIISSEMCFDTSSCISVTISGTNDNAELFNISLFPNPVISTVFIRGIDGSNISRIKLYNLSGLNLHPSIQENAQGVRLDVNQLISGLYYVHIFDSAGNQKVLSFVKE